MEEILGVGHEMTTQHDGVVTLRDCRWWQAAYEHTNWTAITRIFRVGHMTTMCVPYTAYRFHAKTRNTSPPGPMRARDPTPPVTGARDTG